MDPILAGGIALGCYLIGSLSFSRMAVRRFAPEKDINHIQLEILGTGQHMTYQSIGGSAAGMLLGPRMGALVGMMDMLKVILPVLALRILFPTQPYTMVATAAATIGHIWPVFYGFRGGGGYSTIFGGLLVITPLGAIFCSLAGMILGLFVFRSFALLYALQMLLVIPWMAYEFGTPISIVFAVLVNLLFFSSWIPSIKAARAAGKPSRPPTLREVMQQYPMGKALIRVSDRINFNID